MQRVLRHHPLAVLLALLSLTAMAILPMGGVANAASSPRICPNGEGGPQCVLVIFAPESVAFGQPFTVKVDVTTNGRTVARRDSCASKVGVTLDLYYFNGEGYSFGTSYFADASAGIATFRISVPSLPNVPMAQSYQLNALVNFGDAVPPPPCGSYHYVADTQNFAAVTVPEGQPIASCPDNVSCTQTTSGSGSAATLFADTGSFTASFIPRQNLCGDGGPLDPNGVLSFSYTGSSSKTIVFALSPALVTKDVERYNICWQSNNPFTPRGGGAKVTVGYLPNCAEDREDGEDAEDGEGSTQATGPCVLFRRSGRHDAAFFGVRAPPDDPLGYPY